MRIYKKRTLKNKIKQVIQKLSMIILSFIGVLSMMNMGIEYLKKVDINKVSTKTIEFNRSIEVSDSSSDVKKDEVVQATSLPFIESGKESSEIKIKTPSTPVEEKIKEVFGEDEYQIARAVAMAESKLNPSAVGDTHLAKPSIGLFQISQIYHGYDTETLMNPDENIRIAKEIRDRGGWDRWTTFREGTYKNYL